MAEGSSETSQITDASAENGNLHASLYIIMLGFVPADTVKFRVVWKKSTFDVTFGLDEKAIKLKEHIQTLTGH